MQLTKNKTPILTARSAHTKNNSGCDLPVSYEGDTSLLPDEMECISVDMLEGVFSLIAYEYGFELAGDYKPMIVKGEVVLPPPDHPWWEQEARWSEKMQKYRGNSG